jgi:hypothetical protein
MRDLETARSVVIVAAESIMATSLGEVLVDRVELEAAFERAVIDVADLLDPDEVFDGEIDG